MKILYKALFVYIFVFVSGLYAEESHELKQKMFALREEPEIRAFLDMISFAEGTYKQRINGYKMRYPKVMFSSYQAHPAQVICANSNGRRLCSTAAGRYMFLRKIWETIADRLNLQDFSPLNQDIGAIYLLYEKKSLDLIRNEKFEDAIDRVNTVWASLPGAPYGQPRKEMKTLKKVFNERLDHYKKFSFSRSDDET